MTKSFDDGSGLQIKTNQATFDKLQKALMILVDVEVLVGFPEETTDRDPEPGEPSGITNASLGYIHDTGMPEQNIPARPFMTPGMQNAEDAVAAKLTQILKAASQDKGVDVIEKGFQQVGLIAKLAIQNKINEGIPPPLSQRTLQARARKGREGAKQELADRANGMAPGVLNAKPLIDTGQLRNAINYVIRSRRKRRK
jgi:hypothetical protein